MHNIGHDKAPFLRAKEASSLSKNARLSNAEKESETDLPILVLELQIYQIESDLIDIDCVSNVNSVYLWIFIART